MPMNRKRIFLLIIILVMVPYLLYKGFVYWNYNLFKEQKQVEAWNSRVKKQ
nr:MAG TPA: peroxin [Caudoviricetes sp.]